MSALLKAAQDQADAETAQKYVECSMIKKFIAEKLFRVNKGLYPRTSKYLLNEAAFSGVLYPPPKKKHVTHQSVQLVQSRAPTSIAATSCDFSEMLIVAKNCLRRCLVAGENRLPKPRILVPFGKLDSSST